jgi:hypothetical protein
MTQRFAILFFALHLFVSSTLFAQFEPAGNEEQYEKQYEERIKKERLNNIYIPKNLEDACAQLTKLTSVPTREKFKLIPEDSAAYYLLPTLGRWMITNWSFYEGSRMSHYLRSAGITYPEDMAALLIIAWNRNLNARPIEIKELVTRYKDKRKKMWEQEQAEKAATGKVISDEKRKREATTTVIKH